MDWKRGEVASRANCFRQLCCCVAPLRKHAALHIAGEVKIVFATHKASNSARYGGRKQPFWSKVPFGGAGWLVGWLIASLTVRERDQ